MNSPALILTPGVEVTCLAVAPPPPAGTQVFRITANKTPSITALFTNCKLFGFIGWGVPKLGCGCAPVTNAWSPGTNRGFAPAPAMHRTSANPVSPATWGAAETSTSRLCRIMLCRTSKKKSAPLSHRPGASHPNPAMWELATASGFAPSAVAARLFAANAPITKLPPCRKVLLSCAIIFSPPSRNRSWSSSACNTTKNRVAFFHSYEGEERHQSSRGENNDWVPGMQSIPRMAQRREVLSWNGTLLLPLLSWNEANRGRANRLLRHGLLCTGRAPALVALLVNGAYAVDVGVAGEHAGIVERRSG